MPCQESLLNIFFQIVKFFLEKTPLKYRINKIINPIKWNLYQMIRFNRHQLYQTQLFQHSELLQKPLILNGLICLILIPTVLFSAIIVLNPISAQCEDNPPSAIFVNLNGKTPAEPPEPLLKKQATNPAAGQTGKQDSVTAQDQTVKAHGTSTVLVLTKAVMCEYIKGFEPAEPAVVFSISLGKIFCFTGFENISQNAFVYHKWYHRDRFVATNRFIVKAPQWSTFSTMQLRSADKGPWRVEITDDKDNPLETLRFSVVD